MPFSKSKGPRTTALDAAILKEGHYGIFGFYESYHYVK